ncbi:cyclin-domain-containing protein [Podospora appendiculata]|uniref:Cyclin-domain-containing protein n=1 Tax=Podospora appendiculata TaxID=314037 RepID=A0AAE0X024_9PEZI|nr:cyclin-domain-containing protein [Podospora appendiculata]
MSEQHAPPPPEPEAVSDSSSVSSPPPPPVPSTDPKLRRIPSPENDITPPHLAAQVDDIFKLSPLAAIQLLSAGIEALVSMTGDIPPTPPPRSPTIPHMRGMEAEKKSIVRSNSEKNLARLLNPSASNSPRPGRSPALGDSRPSSRSAATSAAQPIMPAQQEQQQQEPQSIDGVRLRSPPPPADAPQPQPPLAPYVIVGENSQPLNLQHSAITRKFYSKLPPPISITDYLMRIHRFCPMSTGVYLATSLYMHRLAVLERAIVVTKRNAHRLLLAGLRVAMKALEDRSYAHNKFAKVGGVSEAELARLEISFCFLVGFELVVTEETLRTQWDILRTGREGWEVLDEGGEGAPFGVPVPVMKPPRRGNITGMGA